MRKTAVPLGERPALAKIEFRDGDQRDFFIEEMFPNAVVSEFSPGVYNTGHRLYKGMTILLMNVTLWDYELVTFVSECDCEEGPLIVKVCARCEGALPGERVERT